MHPLIGDLTKLTDKELAEKINRITKILRSGRGSLYSQSLMILQSYHEEQQRRLRNLLDDQAKEGDVNFDSFINIGQ